MDGRQVDPYYSTVRLDVCEYEPMKNVELESRSIPDCYQFNHNICAVLALHTLPSHAS